MNDEFLERQLIAFFRQAPDEWLYTSDILEKWPLCLRHVQRVVKKLLLTKYLKKRGDMLMAGPRIDLPHETDY
jgi:hypothetical protein